MIRYIWSSCILYNQAQMFVQYSQFSLSEVAEGIETVISCVFITLLQALINKI